MSITELIEQFMDMPETMEGLKSEGEFVVLDTRKVAEELKKSLRNCDVGTAEEQSSRFDSHCRKHMGCLTCPLREKDGGVPKHCELAWAQMPYEEGGEK